MASTSNNGYTLYHDPGSLCSIMARYTFALRGSPANEHAAMHVREQLCSLRASEQLTEHFLCDINPNGEVPVLVPDDAQQPPIPDSVDISYVFASRYPSLLPEGKEGEVGRLVRALHGINFFSLTFAGKPEMQQGNLAVLEARMGEEGTGERYREAIRGKIERLRTNKLAALEPNEVERNVDSTSTYLAEIAQLLERSKSGWILDTKVPTMLDAHVVVFVCRLQDIQRGGLIPEQVRQFAEVAMSQPAWEEVMQGQRTVWVAKS